MSRLSGTFRRRWKSAPWILALGAAVAIGSSGRRMGFSESLEITTDYSVFRDDSGTTVFTPVLKVASPLPKGYRMSFRYAMDAVSAASRNARMSKTHEFRSQECSDCHGSPDVITGASKNFDEQRHEYVAALGFKAGDQDVEGRYIASRERDYASDTVGLTLAREFFKKNTTVSLTLKKQSDDVSFTIRQGEKYKKSGTSVEAGVAHTITPTTLIGAGVGRDTQKGQIGSLYRKVDVNGSPHTESLPTDRRRSFATARLNQYFPWRSSLQLGYRHYYDDWDVFSKTVSVSLFQRVGESLVVTPSYRYYTQTAARYYADHFTEELPFMSSDYNLRPFKAHQWGLRGMVWLTPILSLELGYDHYFQLSHIDYSYGPRDKDLTSDSVQAEFSLRY